LLWLGLAASVLPDLDLLWFYLVDARRHVHHSYVPHLPGFWLVILAAAAAVLALRRAGRAAWLALAVFGSNVLGHLLLDTVAGGIRWLWPATDTEFVLVAVEPRYQPWYLNFLLHWTFALELALVGAAAWVWWHRHTRARRLVASM
jgi:inner membrane protein